VRSPGFLLASRVFATLLLAWTASDLGGHALCLHDHGPIVPGGLAAPDHDAAVGRPGGAPVDAGHSDSLNLCFYCGHCADVQIPYRIEMLPVFVSTLLVEVQPVPELAAAPLYHPPLD